MSVLRRPELALLVDKLHATSDEQLEAMKADYAKRSKETRPIAADEAKEYLRDKLVALDRDKAEFCYQLCRTKNARRVVEIGTSYGVSTLYLAAAVCDNVDAGGGSGIVIGTEYEPEKARAARAHFAEAGVSQFIDLREGDLRETLKSITGPIDFVLIDIWIDMALPALQLLIPHLAQNVSVICDNTELYQTEYADYLAFLHDPKNGFRTMTLPFAGGLEFSIRCNN
jgi:predicted O-methyltransferase YrrM